MTVKHSLTTAAVGVAASLALSACTLTDFANSFSGAVADITTVANAIDTGVTDIAAANLPLVCTAVGAFISLSQDAVSAKILTPSSTFAKDLQALADLDNGPGCAPGTTPASAFQLVDDIIIDVGTVKSDLSGKVSVVSAVNASVPSPTARAVRRWRLSHRRG